MSVFAATSLDAFEKEVAEDMKVYDFVLTNKMGLLKTDDQWIEEVTQKRRLRQGSAKSFAWLHPFLPTKVINLSELKQLLELGPKSAAEIAKQLRAQIRERKKAEQPYNDLNTALYSTPQLKQIQMWEPQCAASEIAKQLRVLILERRKNKKSYDDLLLALYGTRVAEDFARSLAFEGYIGDITHHVDLRELRNIRINYSTMGYHYIESFLKTDIKWLVDAFGEPSEHQPFDAQWPTIRQNAVSRYCWEQLRISNEETSSSRRIETSMLEWLQNRMSSNLRYYRERWVRHKEWLGRDDEWLKQRVDVIPEPSKFAHSFSLDMSSIEAKLAETSAVSALLKDVFTEDAPSAANGSPGICDYRSNIAGLDAESFTFMQALASKRIWARDELETLADHHSLMLDGTLDNINDASYDHFGGPFFEGDDPIEINPEFAKEITA